MGHRTVHLRHEVHGHDNDDQQRSAAKQNGTFHFRIRNSRQQTDQTNIDRTNQRQTQNDAFDIARSLLTGRMPGMKAPLFWVVGGFLPD